MENPLDQLPEEVQKGKYFIDFADQLFKSQSVRFTFTEGDAPCVKIILGENLTLFFFKKEGEWKYDGWEMGDYKDYWTNGNL